MIRRLIVLCMALFGLGATPVHADTPLAGGTLVQISAFPSALVTPRQVSIWLPAGYATSGRRYPVVYFHDGQNLFDPATAYGGKTWGVAETLSAMHVDAIVVGIWNTKQRGREYFPAKVFALLPPDQQANAVATHGGAPLSDAYLQFIVTELKPAIDRAYRTRPGRADTSMAGSSMGGLISLYAMAEYPQVFGQVACLSVHWPMSDPRKSDPAVVTAAWAGYLKTSHWQPGQNRLYMDHGTLTLDSFYRPYAERMEAALPQMGWQRDKNWVSRVFEGGAHDEASWRARLATPMQFLLGSEH
ncbi:alpha/beta hydrolase-fold protein [Novosphingobium sp.]|uniref:alpha/beta hydrolase n=1 Tax=Novosphingobium sp. TaxID=1874826 RepID=UPI00333EB07F